MKTHMKMLALGGILALGTLGCSTDMAQSPSSASQASYENYGNRSDTSAEAEPYERSYQATEEHSSPATEEIVQGELVKIDGDYYVVKDSLTSKEVRFHVDKNVSRLDKDGGRMAEQFQLGDWIQAQLTPEGDVFFLQAARMAPSEQPLP